MIEEAYGSLVRERREARRESLELKRANEALQLRNKVLENRKTNGVVLTVQVTENINGVVNLLFSDKEAFESAVADWLSMPEDAVITSEATPRIDGTLVATIEVSPKAPVDVWDKLSKLRRGEGQLMEVTDDLAVQVAEVRQRSGSFVAKFTGSVGSMLDNDFEADVREELEAQLALPSGALQELAIVNVTGKMSVQVFVSVHDVVTDKVESQGEDVTLDGPHHITCSIEVMDTDEFDNKSAAVDSDAELSESVDESDDDF